MDSTLSRKKIPAEKSSPDWNNRLSQVVQTIKPSGIREFFDIVAQRTDCISLGVGEPDFVTPQPVIDSAIQALREGYTHYTGNQGLFSLRKAISDYLKKEYDIFYNPESQILITVGVSQGLDLAFRSAVNPGDKILYPEPGYVSYDPMIRLAGAQSVKALASGDNNFELDRTIFEQAWQENTRILFLNYPCNPTGAGLTRKKLSGICDFAQENDLLVISDEIYGELTYEQGHIPIATMPGMYERTLLLGGFSKSFAMTGWRIGYACGNEHWIKAMTKIHQYSMLCAPTLGQIAAEAALKFSLPDRDAMRESYRERRDLITSGFNAMGLACAIPQGAFYVFPDIRSTGLSSMQFAKELLERQNVAVVPGTAFGDSGEGFIRCSYATSMAEIRKALEKIHVFVNSFPPR